MDCNTPGLPVHHQLLEFTQTHVNWVSGAIQPSHPLSSPSPPAFSLSQHQGSFQMSQFFTSDGQSTGVSALASVLPMNTQDWFPLGWTGWIFLQSKGLSRVFSLLLDHQKTKRVTEIHLLLFYWLCLWLCGSQQTVENSSRDGNTRPPDLPPEKSVCRSRSNS